MLQQVIGGHPHQLPTIKSPAFRCPKPLLCNFCDRNMISTTISGGTGWVNGADNMTGLVMVLAGEALGKFAEFGYKNVLPLRGAI
ncbi:hypothetical protein C1752_03373 [Acaryochloris thomasi RCC1774]|uniref:Uncharacterized protein n=1 Tax=Acaryochloris thomasi RCC1774 TaxID=1764569 RepID=A0A2W1JN74_9CYAN|nr:hypothetical protein [Acaryochloris thomasi]PZD72895.1 hypothetical protein C1752_03373 [Acaryochloris thomasi RCC1774]